MDLLILDFAAIDSIYGLTDFNKIDANKGKQAVFKIRDKGIIFEGL